MKIYFTLLLCVVFFVSGVVHAQDQEQAHIEQAKVALLNYEMLKAEQQYLLALEYSPKSLEIGLGLVGIYHSQQRFNEASLRLSDLLLEHPQNVNVLQTQVTHYEMQQKIDKATDVYQKLISLPSVTINVLDQASRFFEQQNKLDLVSEVETKKQRLNK